MLITISVTVLWEYWLHSFFRWLESVQNPCPSLLGVLVRNFLPRVARPSWLPDTSSDSLRKP